MKKKIAIVALLVLLAVLLFPVSKTHVISGKVLTEEMESCEIAVEITELSSLAVCYKKQFTVTLDGKNYTKFETNTHSEADDFCMISQMYYDEIINEMNLCSLVYQKDLSEATLTFGDVKYHLINGSDVTIAGLPVS